MSAPRERVKDEERWEERDCPFCGRRHLARIRPSMQWYPADEERETGLRLVSLAAFGLWHRMLNVMHTAVPRGWLVGPSGKALEAAELARIVGETPALVKKLIAELEANAVFSRTTEKVIFSRRMIRDEHISNVRAAAGSKGGNPTLVNQEGPESLTKSAGLLKQRGDESISKRAELLNQHPKQIPTPSSSSSTSLSSSPSPSPSSNSKQPAVSSELPADRLTAAANRAISERFGEQSKPLRHDARGATMATEAILAASVPIDFACDAIFTCVQRADKPPYSLGYFTEHVIDRWHAEQEHQAARASTATSLPDDDGYSGVSFVEVAKRMPAR